mmetsp:Transcript_4551/g.5640  ORF Transcript_4551/g.5640 Transcript_4551/m.5640 type:complete len:172 (-) Transcript_4551:690-1205(-)|eukprot:jgi/Bigna1/90039/estExt_fgenesh1_pg.C_610006
MGSSTSKLPALRTVKDVDIPKFIGDWYVIGVIPTYFEKGACNPIEKYSWDSKKKAIAVDFQFNKGTVTGAKKSIQQTLYVDGYPKASGSMKASPFWPVKLPYLLMELSDDHTNCMVGYPSRAYLWIMSKSKSMDKKIYEEYVQIAKEQHYDVSKIENPPHEERKEEENLKE